MSLNYKPFDQSRPPTQLKGATFEPMNFHFIDGPCHCCCLLLVLLVLLFEAGLVLLTLVLLVAGAVVAWC